MFVKYEHFIAQVNSNVNILKIQIISDPYKQRLITPL